MYEQILEEAKNAYSEWRKVHTVDNRTPAEMFYFGYITEEAKNAYSEWRKVHTVDNRTPAEMFYSGYITAKENQNV